jgi:hypothetical protein
MIEDDTCVSVLYVYIVIYVKAASRQGGDRRGLPVVAGCFGRLRTSARVDHDVTWQPRGHVMAEGRNGGDIRLLAHQVASVEGSRPRGGGG